MNELTTVNKKTITNVNAMGKIITTIGTKSKELCIKMHETISACETVDEQKETIKYIIETLNLSKSSVSKMRKSGEMYKLFPELENMSHTKIYELNPLVETDYTMEEFAFYSLGHDVESISEIDELTQKEIRYNVKSFLNDEVIEEEEIEEEEIEEEEIEEEEIEETEETEDKDTKMLILEMIIGEYNINEKDATFLRGLI